MSISVLENENGECDALIEAIKKHEKKTCKIMRKTKGSPNYRMGFHAGLDGFELNAHELQGYDDIYPGYAKGLMDGQKRSKVEGK